MIYSGGEEEERKEKEDEEKNGVVCGQPFMCEGIQRIGAIEQGVMDECNAQPARTPFRKNTVTPKETRSGISNPLFVIAHPPIQGDYNAALKGLVDG